MSEEKLDNEERLQNIERLMRISAVMLTFMALIFLGIRLQALGSILLPFVFAIFLLLTLNPVINFFEKRGVPSKVSILLTLVIVTGLLFGVGTVIDDNLDDFILQFPKYEPRINQLTQDAVDLLQINSPGAASDSNATAGPEFTKILDTFSFSTVIKDLVSALSALFSNAVMVLLIFMFFLLGRNSLATKIPKAFEKETSEKIAAVVKNIHTQIEKYMLAKTVISFVTALLSWVILLIFGVEFAAVWALLTFLLNFIPSIGSIIATVLPLSVAVIQFEELAVVVWLGVLLFAVQFIIGNVAEPKIMGKHVNLSPVVILYGLLYWGWMWGIVGMLLAVPLMVTMKIICENVKALRFVAVLMSSPSD